jgi:thioredoxin-like negative regulator of GroEL
MKRNHIILLSVAAVVFAAIYLFAPTKKTHETIKQTAVNTPEDSHEHEAVVLDIESYITTIKQQITDQKKIEIINQAESRSDFNLLIEVYKGLDKPLAVAHYAAKQAKVENTLPSLLKAGDYNSMLAQTAPDQSSKSFLLTNAIELYSKATTIDSNNTDNKIRLATAYIEEGSQPMQGVSMLLDIVRRDSTNMDAQLMLGRFGLISGQLDKAIVRLEKVLYSRPQNSEALFLLAEVYNAKGDKNKAVELLEKCKQTMKTPELKSEIDKYIETIKQPAAN